MFITVEGIEGAGKSAIIGHLAEALRQRGQKILLTREPGGCPLGLQLRQLLLNASSKLEPLAELFLFQADRAQHVSEIILPALKQGKWVLCDRYYDSTLAYQGYGRGLDLQGLKQLNSLASQELRPDLTLLLDLPPKTGLSRARGRNEELGLSHSEGRFEAETLAFHQRIREGFLALAKEEPQRWRIINAAAPLEEVQAAALACLKLEQ